MKLTPKAKQELIKFLSKNNSKVPGIAWACDEDYSDYIKDGFWQFGFYDLEKIKERGGERFLVDVEGIDFAIDIPEVLKPQLSELCIDLVDSNFIIRNNSK